MTTRRAPPGAYFCWPLRLDVAGLRLEWATAQPVCLLERDGRTVLVLAAVDGIAPELALEAATVTSVSPPSGNTVPVADRLLVTGLRPGTDAWSRWRPWPASGSACWSWTRRRHAPSTGAGRGVRSGWDIGLDRLPGESLRAEGLRLRVLPSHADAAVYVPREAGDRGRAAAVRRAEWVTARTWALRSG